MGVGLVRFITTGANFTHNKDYAIIAAHGPDVTVLDDNGDLQLVTVDNSSWQLIELYAMGKLV